MPSSFSTKLHITLDHSYLIVSSYFLLKQHIIPIQMFQAIMQVAKCQNSFFVVSRPAKST